MVFLKDNWVLSKGEQWFVVNTLPHKEACALMQLENQRYRVFLPRIKKTRRHARKLDTVFAPFFPNYLFVILNLKRDQWRSVNGTIGVSRLVMQNDRPQPVPGGIVESFIELTDDKGLLRFDASGGFKIGQHIEIMTGPFAKQIGEITQLDSKMRMSVLLDIMGRRASVQVRGASARPAAA